MAVLMRSIFVSKPSALSAERAAFWVCLQKLLKDRGLEPRTLGESDFPNSAPVNAVAKLMHQCEGAVILGFVQTHIKFGLFKPETPIEHVIDNWYLPTPWNQIEAGMAFALHLPCLIIREAGVRGGVFEIGSTDKFIHQAVMDQAWLDSPAFLGPLNEWYDDIAHRFIRGSN